VLLLVQEGHSSLRRLVNFNHQMSVSFAKVFVVENLRIMENQWISGSPIDSAKLQKANSVFPQARMTVENLNLHQRLTERVFTFITGLLKFAESSLYQVSDRIYIISKHFHKRMF
jgi:hypothetical protein